VGSVNDLVSISSHLQLQIPLSSSYLGYTTRSRMTHLRPLFGGHRIDRDDIPIPSSPTPHIPTTSSSTTYRACPRSTRTLRDGNRTTPRGRLAEIVVFPTA
jgi:hypothetical protein